MYLAGVFLTVLLPKPLPLPPPVWLKMCIKILRELSVHTVQEHLFLVHTSRNMQIYKRVEWNNGMWHAQTNMQHWLVRNSKLGLSSSLDEDSFFFLLPLIILPLNGTMWISVVVTAEKLNSALVWPVSYFCCVVIVCMMSMSSSSSPCSVLVALRASSKGRLSYRSPLDSDMPPAAKLASVTLSLSFFCIIFGIIMIDLPLSF